MKVGITAGVYYPEIGGSATYLHRLRRNLLSEGHHVRVVCFGEGRDEPGVFRVSRQLPLPQRLYRFTYLVARWLHDADIWFVNDYGLSAALLRPFLRRPMLMKIIGDWAWQSAVNSGVIAMPEPSKDPLVEFQRQRQPLRAEVRKLLQARLARAMDRVLVPSAYLADVVALWGVPPERITVIHNGVLVGDLAERTERDSTLVVAAARLTRWKGIDDLLRAFCLVVDDVATARLVVLGDGPERPALESLAADLGFGSGVVTFVGTVDRPEVQRYLERAAAFALPSAYEGLPHVVLEALAAGCPVVAAGAGGTPEVIRDGLDGLLVPVGDAAALRSALVRLLTDRATADRLRQNGRTRVRSSFSWETAAR